MNQMQFSSFFMGGFECSFHKSKEHRLDILADTKHEENCESDYELLKLLGISTVREGFAWHQIDKGNHLYDFSRFEKIIEVGARKACQQIWDLNHFDYPDDLDPFSEEFITRFSSYAKQAVCTLRRYCSDTLYIVPFNEISFFSWMAAEVGNWAPFMKDLGFKLKKQCVKAVLAAINAIKQIDSNVKFIHTDPLMYRIPLDSTNRLTCEYAEYFNEIRYQMWDMIVGNIFPELGGHPSYLDMIGINYYLHNQEYVLDVQKTGEGEFTQPICQPIPLESHQRATFLSLFTQIYERYQCPIVIAETGCFGNLRHQWWLEHLAQIEKILAQNFPLVGVCAYPVIDRPDWVDKSLTNSGFWDFHPNDEKLIRQPHTETINLVREFIIKQKTVAIAE